MQGMTLILVQHGEALPKEVDPERSLSDKGRGDVVRLASLLHKASIEPGEILHSGKKRALETAVLLAGRLTPGREPVLTEGLRPKDPPGALKEMLASRSENLMLVSH
ncbi:MAG: SixA phosphatase family protein, partial [Planctomycetota bacterium]